jgi:peptidoglycan L-alanyl-D-glutamate endopeptidase CwlK
MFKFGTRSLSNLVRVHEDLQKVMHKSIATSPYDFTITEGLRSPGRQQKLVDEGRSTTMNSRHLTGHAIDLAVLVGGKVIWDMKEYQELALHIKAVAKELEVPIVWGGDWNSLVDAVHYELDRKVYK